MFHVARMNWILSVKKLFYIVNVNMIAMNINAIYFSVRGSEIKELKFESIRIILNMTLDNGAVTIIYKSVT